MSSSPRLWYPVTQPRMTTILRFGSLLCPGIQGPIWRCFSAVFQERCRELNPVSQGGFDIQTLNSAWYPFPVGRPAPDPASRSPRRGPAASSTSGPIVSEPAQGLWRPWSRRGRWGGILHHYKDRSHVRGFIVCVNLTGSQGTQAFGQTLCWVCPCFWRSLALECIDWIKQVALRSTVGLVQSGEGLNRTKG